MAAERGERDWKRICQEELKAHPPLLLYMGYLLCGLSAGLALVLAVVVLNFMLVHAAPGDPVETIAGASGGMEPELMAELKTVKAGDIHLERAESVGPRIQSLLRFSAADYADMQARLDPAGFGIVASMLNHHARARFSSFLDELMANAGY